MTAPGPSMNSKPCQTRIRNRIKGHRRVRAGDLVPHELNFRLHPEHQRAALQALDRLLGNMPPPNVSPEGR